jgi:hypothetical protein
MNDLFVREVLEVDMKIGVSDASGHLGRAVVSEPLQRPGEHEVVPFEFTHKPEAERPFAEFNAAKER